MLTRLLDAIDETAGAFIRLAYLMAGVSAVALYFGAGHLPAIVEAGLNAALPWCLAAAIETHTYISARRVRAAWQNHERGALRVNLAILGGLLAFSSWNQLGYLAATWIPLSVSGFALPRWLALLIRALVVPAAFMAAAFLAPSVPPVTMQIEAEARATLSDVFRIARKQRRRMLRDAEHSGRDMTGALVELVPDADVRRIIAHAYAAIGAPTELPPTVGGSFTLTPAAADREVFPESFPPDGEPPRPPRTKRTRKRSGRVLQLAPPRARAAAILAAQPDISVRELADRAHVSRSTAARYRRARLAQESGEAADG